MVQQGMRPATNGWRAARATVLSVACTGLAVAAHALSAGCVDAVGLVLVFTAVLPASWVVTAHQQSAPTLLAWLAGAQVAAHLIQAGACGDRLLDRTPQAIGLHAVAVLLTAGLLHAADAALWTAGRLLEATRRVLRMLVVTTIGVSARPGLAGVVQPTPTVRPRLRAASPAVRRGPPGVVHASC